MTKTAVAECNSDFRHFRCSSAVVESRYTIEVEEFVAAGARLGEAADQECEQGHDENELNEPAQLYRERSLHSVPSILICCRTCSARFKVITQARGQVDTWPAYKRKGGPSNMAKTLHILKRVLRPTAFVVMRYLLPRINPAIVGSWTESIVRRLGFSQPPTLTDIVVNYLRGFVLFGRDNPYGTWFYWHGVSARYVITADTATVPNRLRPVQRRGELEVRYDQDIEAVMHCCQKGRTGFLTPELVNLYLEMQESGLIVSVGTYREGRLVGGFWGLDIGGVFGIMSMFHLESNAGTLALGALVEIVAHQGRWSVIDCGAGGAHWKRYGATELSRQQFSALVTKTLLKASLNGRTAILPKPDWGA